MSDPFVAEIRAFGFNYAPLGWATCDGQLLPLNQNTALFSLLGTTYGGDGRVTFALPNLRGASPMHAGQAPGLSDYYVGQVGGSETVTLLENQMPGHNHGLVASTTVGTDVESTGHLLGKGQKGNPISGITQIRTYSTATSGTPNASLSPQAMDVSGGSLPHNNLMPYLVLNFCIAMQGVFPQRP